MGKKYYIAIERYDKDDNLISRRFVNERAFGCLFSFTTDINNAKFFGRMKDATDYTKNLICASREKIVYEEMYDNV